MGLTGWGRVGDPSTLRMVIWPEAERAQNSMGTVSAEGGTIRVSPGLDAAAEFLAELLDGVGRSRRLPQRRRQACEDEQAPAGFFQAAGDGAALQAPFPQERLAAGLNFGGGLGVDHVAVVFGQLVVQVLGRMGEKVPMLMHGAALDRQLLAA